MKSGRKRREDRGKIGGKGRGKDLERRRKRRRRRESMVGRHGRGAHVGGGKISDFVFRLSRYHRRSFSGPTRNPDQPLVLSPFLVPSS